MNVKILLNLVESSFVRTTNTTKTTAVATITTIATYDDERSSRHRRLEHLVCFLFLFFFKFTDNYCLLIDCVIITTTVAPHDNTKMTMTATTTIRVVAHYNDDHTTK
jgi:hypothetical protein